MDCPTCHSQTVVKNGTTKRQDGSVVQKYLCKCAKRATDNSTSAVVLQCQGFEHRQ